MTGSFTQIESFSIVYARYLGSKLAGDLWQVHRFYPSLLPEERKNNLVEEAVQMIAKGYLQRADYGLIRNGEWILRLRYEVRSDGSMTTDDECGGVRIIDASGATFYSYLTYSTEFMNLSESERVAFKRGLPVQRTTNDEETPLAVGGTTQTYDKAYSKGGTSIQRSTFFIP